MDNRAGNDWQQTNGIMLFFSYHKPQNKYTPTWSTWKVLFAVGRSFEWSSLCYTFILCRPNQLKIYTIINIYVWCTEPFLCTLSIATSCSGSQYPILCMRDICIFRIVAKGPHPVTYVLHGPRGYLQSTCEILDSDLQYQKTNNTVLCILIITRTNQVKLLYSLRVQSEDKCWLLLHNLHGYLIVAILHLL